MENRRLSLLYKLQNLYNTSSVGSVDFQLALYFINKYQQISELNIFDVAEENNVSRASVRRFCSQLGYENFKELKLHYIEFDDGLDTYKDFYEQIDFISNLRLQINTMFSELENRLSNRELKQIVTCIHHSDEVVVVASSTIANSMRVFQQTMAIMGKRISLVVSEEDFLNIEQRLTDKSLIIFFSISGLLAETFEDLLFDRVSKIFLFTNSRNPKFNQLFDCVYHLTSMDKADNRDIIYYTYGISFVLDSIIHEYSKLI
ncbi:TPA: MurR/RpiR family transcriptional regulator [Streptococcus suis]|nr:MurR/RpiR family transcriptional regulator [Streptococcus suis]